MALIAHVLHFSKKEILNMTLDEISFWAEKADELLTALYPPNKGGINGEKFNA